MVDFLQRLAAGSREGCFLDGNLLVDVAAACHEFRGPPGLLRPGERIGISFGVGSEKKGSDQFVVLGETCYLKNCKVDAVVLVCLWASCEDPSMVEGANRRVIGQVRVPLRCLAVRYDSALYHSWLLLEDGSSPAPSGGGACDFESLESALRACGSAQLAQPKICLSVCQIKDLAPSGRVLWSADTPDRERAARWGALLRSQQQHAAMCAAQIAAAQVRPEPSALERRSSEIAKGEAETQLLERQSSDQARELDELKRRLHEARRQQQPVVRGVRMRPGAQAAASQRDAQIEVVSARLRHKLEELEAELNTVGEEANGKIEAANGRIRALRHDCEEASRAAEAQSAENRRLYDEKSDVSVDIAKLAEQKGALLRIVEDLHQACEMAGLSGALDATGRLSLTALSARRP